MATRRLEVVIAGDAKGALGSLTAVDRRASGLGGRFASIGKAAAAGFAVVGAAAIGAGAALYKIGSDFDSAYDTIRINTGKTGESLAGLQQSFRNVVRNTPTDFATASQAIAGLNQRLHLTGQPLEAVSRRMLELSRMTHTDLTGNIQNITRVFGDWGVQTAQMPSTMDMLFRATQQTGVGLDQLTGQVVQFGAPLRNLGFSFQDSVAMLSQFEAQGVNTSTVMSGLRQGLKNFAAAGEEPSQAFRRFVSGVKGGTLTMTDAMHTFGARAGADMFAAIREGRFDFDHLSNSIANGHDTIMRASHDTRDFGEQWQIIKNRIWLKLEPLATAVFAGVGNAMVRLGPVVNQVGRWFSENIPPAIVRVREIFERDWPRIRDTVLGAIAAIQGFWARNGPQIMATISDLVGMFRSGFEGVRLIVTRVLGVIMNIWDRFGSQWLGHVQTAFGAIAQIFRGVFQVIHGIWETFIGVFTGDWGRAWDGVKSTFGGVWNVIVGTLRAALNGISGVIGAAMAAISAVWGYAWRGIQNVARVIWHGIYSLVGGQLHATWALIRTVLGVIVGWWSAQWGRVRAIVSFTWQVIRAGVSTGIHAVSNTIHTVMAGVSTAWHRVWSGMHTVVSNIWDRITGTIRDAIRGVRRIVGGFLSPVAGVADAVGLDALAHTLRGIAGHAAGTNQLAVANAGSRGYVTNGITAVVGEGSRTHPEYVIPTDPRHRGRALMLFQQLGAQLLGVGGIISGAASGIGSAVSGALDLLPGANPLDIARQVVAGGLSHMWPTLPVPHNMLGIPPAAVNRVRSTAIDFIRGRAQHNIDAAAVHAAAAAGGPANIVAELQRQAALRGWNTGANWGGLTQIIAHESGWNPTAQNPTSTAYGLFQFLNGTWAGTGIAKTSNYIAQITAGLRYIASRYGDPAHAWSFWQQHHSYDKGGWLPPGLTLAYNGTGRPERVLGPYDHTGGGGITLNLDVTVEGSVLTTDRDLAAALDQALRRGTVIPQLERLIARRSS